MSADATVTANFDLLPTITVPAAGAVYPAASVPAAAFVCAPGDTACAALLDGQPINNGDALSAVPGPHTLTVAGTGADGAQVSRQASYTAEDPPTAQISAPSAGDTYAKGQVVRTKFQCASGVRRAPGGFVRGLARPDRRDGQARHGSLGPPYLHGHRHPGWTDRHRRDLLRGGGAADGDDRISERRRRVHGRTIGVDALQLR